MGVSADTAAVASRAGGVAQLPRRLARKRLSLSAPAAVLASLGISRAIVLLAGIAGGLWLPRVSGWQMFDPQQLSAHLGAAGNVLAAPAVRWDSIWYLHIAAHGYSSATASGFLPLYPLLVAAVGEVVGSTAVAGVLISVASLAVGLTLLHRLTELELGRAAADATVLLLGLAPVSLFFSAVYTESLFLALAVGTFLAARLGRWRLAAMLGVLASLTRVTGVLLLVAVLVGHGRPRLRAGLLAPKGLWRSPRRWMLLLPAGPSLFAGYLVAHGYGVLAPLQAQTSNLHDHQLLGPVVAVGDAIGAAASGLDFLVRGVEPLVQSDSLGGSLSPSAESLVLLGVLLVSVVALHRCWRVLPPAYGVWALLALLVSVWSPVAGQPLKSLDRYTLTIFPLWMAAGGWLARRRALWPVLACSAVLLALYTLSFTTWSFVA